MLFRSLLKLLGCGPFERLYFEFIDLQQGNFDGISAPGGTGQRLGEIRLLRNFRDKFRESLAFFG